MDVDGTDFHSSLNCGRSSPLQLKREDLPLQFLRTCINLERFCTHASRESLVIIGSNLECFHLYRPTILALEKIHSNLKIPKISKLVNALPCCWIEASFRSAAAVPQLRILTNSPLDFLSSAISTMWKAFHSEPMCICTVARFPKLYATIQ